MATVDLQAGSMCVSVSVRDAKLREVWSGVIEGSASIGLDPGYYDIEVADGELTWHITQLVEDTNLTLDLMSSYYRQAALVAQSRVIASSVSIEPDQNLMFRKYAVEGLSNSKTVSAAGSVAVVMHEDGEVVVGNTGDGPQQVTLDVGWPAVTAAVDEEGSHAVLRGEGGQMAVYDLRSVDSPRKLRIARNKIRGLKLQSASVGAVRGWVDPIALDQAALPSEPIQIALWQRKTSGRWKLDVTPRLDAIRYAHGMQRFLRVSRSGVGTWIVSLPEEVDRIELPRNPRGKRAIRVVDADNRASLMHRLFEQRDHRAAARVATSRLQTKVQAPIGAAEGALAIVRLRGQIDASQLPPLGWFENLAKHYAWLPDGMVAHAWFGITTGELQPDQVLDALLQAAQAGVPTITDGLLLLRDGLELAAEGKGSASHLATETLERVRRWVALADLESRRTLLANSGGLVFQNRPTSSSYSSGRLKRGLSLYELEGFTENDNTLRLHFAANNTGRLP